MSKTTEEKQQKPSSAACEGKLVSLTGNKLVMTGKDGKQSTLTLAKDAQLTCDGTACKADDLKAGGKIRLTTKKDDKAVATGVESLKKNAELRSAIEFVPGQRPELLNCPKLLPGWPVGSP